MNNQGRTRSCNRNRSKPTSFTPRGSKQICIPMTRELYDEIWHDAEPVRSLLERLIAESPEVFPDGICAGYRLSGRFAPVPGGLKFLADEVLINGQYTSLRASSDMIRDERDIREDSGKAVARDSAIRVVGGALSGAFTGGVDWGGILGGTAAGVIMQNATAPRVVVVRPDRSINLRLDAPFSIRR